MNALTSFNNDMKALALNAYQLEDLLDLSLQENDAFIEWLSVMEDRTTKSESRLFKFAKKAIKLSRDVGMKEAMKDTS